MKTSIKRFSKSAVSVLLAVMMLLTTVSTYIAATVDTEAVSSTTGEVTIYFKNTVNWSSVYVYFYGDSGYFDSNNGAGSNGYSPNAMTKVASADDGDIYSYTGNVTYSSNVAFTEASQSGYNNFWQTKAAYRTDFSTSTPMYVPDSSTNTTYNRNVPYYNTGEWQTYSEEEPTTVAPTTQPASSTQTVYLNTNSYSSWSDTYHYAVWSWSSGGSGIAYNMTKVSDGVYSVEVPADRNNIIFFRLSSSKTFSDGETNWNNVNEGERTSDQEIPSGSNMFTISGGTESNQRTGSWSTYAKTYTYSAKVYTRDVNLNSDPSSPTYYAATESSAGGKVTGIGTFAEGASTTVSYETNENYTFTGWYNSDDVSGEPASTAEAYAIENINADATFYALFSQNPATVEISLDDIDNATATLTVGGRTIDEGESLTVYKGATVTVTLSDIPTGYTVKSYSPDATVSDNTYTFVANSDTTFTASITEDLYTVTVSSETGGTITSATPVQAGVTTHPTISVDVADGYTFGGWSVPDGITLADSSSTTTTITNATSNGTVTAKLTQNRYSVTISATEGGIVSVEGEATIPGVTGQEVTATANPGYEFSGWTVTGGARVSSASNATTTVYATGVGTVTANFTAKQTYGITTSVTGNGTVTADPTSTYEGATVTLNVEAGSGYKLSTLTVKDADNNNITVTDNQFIMPASDVTVTATFVEDTSNTIYIINDINWSPLKIYTWNGTTTYTGAWPGTTVIKNSLPVNDKTTSDLGLTVTSYQDPNYSNKTVYKITGLSEDIAKIQFNKGNGTDQTGDKDFTNNALYRVYSDNGNQVEIIKDYTEPVQSTITVTETGDIESGRLSAVKVNDTEYTDPVSAYNTTTVTLTVSPADNYSATVSGTYNSNPIEFTKSGNTYTFTMPSTDVNITVNYAEKAKTVLTYSSSDDTMGSVNSSTASGSTVYEGNTVTINAKPNKGYAVSYWTVNGVQQPNSASSTFSYEVTASVADETLIQPVFYKLPTYSVTFSGGDHGTITAYDTYGDEVTSGDQVSEGMVVSFHVENNDSTNYTYVNSTITGNATSSTTQTDFGLTITGNTTVTANFKEDQGTEVSGKYLIFNPNNDNNPANLANNYTKVYYKNGHFYAYITDTSYLEKGDHIYFALSSSSTNYKEMYYQKDSGLSVSSTDTTNVSASQQPYNADETSYYFGHAVINTEDVTGLTIDLGEGSSASADIAGKYYKVTPSIDPTAGTRIKVYAKDGTYRDGYTKYADMADTTFTSGIIGTAESYKYYEVGKVEIGSTINIQTTISDDYKDTYYVRGFDINGVTYGDANVANDSGVYTATITITQEMVDTAQSQSGSTSIEITPVYYYKSNTDMIYFHVTGYDETVQNAWKTGTLAVHAWYYEGFDEVSYDDATKNALGGYPGQPMINEGGMYTMQIPRYLNGDKDNEVSGVTLNNYVWDFVHSEIYGYTSDTNREDNNCQTYDFRDFYSLSKKSDVESIIFAFKYETETDNRTLSVSTDVPTDYNDSRFGNGFEPLTDYYGNIVDIFGNILSQYTTETVYSATDYAMVVSRGYQSNEIDELFGNGNRSIGDSSNLNASYATSWTAYYNGAKVFTTNSNTLLNVDTSTLSDTNRALENKPVFITYEKSIKSGNQIGNRSDGRWYYSTVAAKISANVKIQYTSDEVVTSSTTWTDDAFITDTHVGTTTGTSAYFTGDSAYEGKTTTGEVTQDEEATFEFQADSDSSGEYMFYGWYRDNGNGNYTKISGNPAYAARNGNATFVARFVKTPSGSLTINHKMLNTLSNDVLSASGVTANNGTGTLYLSAQIVDENDNVIATYSETTGSIVIGASYITGNSTNSIKVTLRTVCDGDNSFVSYYYHADAADMSTVTTLPDSPTGGSEVSSVRTFTIASLFDVDEDTGLPTDVKYDALNYYSDILAATGDYKITYNYKDRFGDDQIYVVKGTFDQAYIAKNGYNITSALVAEKAPYEDNFGKTISWNLDEKDITFTEGSSSTTATANVTSDQEVRTVTLTYTPYGEATKQVELDWGSLAKLNEAGEYDVNGDYLYAENTIVEDDVTKTFNYWLITNTKTGQEIAKSYSHYFNYLVIDNYTIKPVYAETVTPHTQQGTGTDISFLEYSRNQWTTEDGRKASNTDKLYADFEVEYYVDGRQVTSDDTDVQVGVLFVVGDKLTEEEATNFDQMTTTKTFDVDEDALISLIESGVGGKVDGRNVLLKTYNITTISNKNRITYYRGFNNSKYDASTDTYDYTNAMYIMKVYSYIIVDGVVTLCNTPQYVNLYDTATQNYTVK